MHPAPPPTTRPASPIQDYLEELHARFSDLRSGQVASYIPELAKADPAWFGIAIATVDGQVYEVGDSRQQFTIQSISKPLVYGLALEDRGAEAVRRKVGVEPSGDAFNAISLEPHTGRPLNPMINAGAIATASLVNGREPRGAAGARDRRHLRVCRATPGARRSGLRSETPHRPSQPRHRPHAAQLRDPGRCAGAGARPLLPPVLGAGRLPRPGADGRDAGQRRRQSGQRRARRRRRSTSSRSSA